jgi:hypothetical protein
MVQVSTVMGNKTALIGSSRLSHPTYRKFKLKKKARQTAICYLQRMDSIAL